MHKDDIDMQNLDTLMAADDTVQFDVQIAAMRRDSLAMAKMTSILDDTEEKVKDLLGCVFPFNNFLLML